MNLLDLAVKITLDDQVTGKLSSFARNVKHGFSVAAGMAVKGLGAASAAVSAFGLSSVKTGMEFDSAMSQVAATMGKTVQELSDDIQTVMINGEEFTGSLRDYAQKMGAETAFSATQAAEALNYMALAGYDAKTSMEMLPNVLNLAAAGNIDLAQASDMVTDAQSALGLDLDQTVTMVDQMAAASSRTNTSVQQLGEAFLTVGGTAQSLRGGTQELAQALGLLADNGIKGSEGGTALRNVLLGISSEKFEDTFGALGVSAYDAEGNMRSLKDVFMDMNAAMADMTDEQRTKLLSESFNKVDLKSLNALLGTDAERWDEVAEAIGNCEGAAANMAATQLDNLQGDVTLLKSAFEGLQIAVSDQLTPGIRKFAQFAGAALQDLTTAFKEGGIDGFMEKFSEVLDEGLQLIGDSLPQVVDAGVMLLGALLTGIIEAAPKVLQSCYDIARGLIDTVRQNIPAMMNAAGEFILSFLTTMAQNGPQILSDFVQMLAELVGYVIAHIPDMLAAAGELILTFLQAISETDIAQAIGAFIQSAVDRVGEFFTDMYNAGAHIIEGLIEGIKSMIDSVGSTILGGISGAVDGVKNFLGIKSPSKLFAEIGENTMLGMARGIDEAAGAAEKAMLDAVGLVNDASETNIGLAGNVASGGVSWPLTANGSVNAIGDMLLAEVQSLHRDIGNMKLYIDSKVAGGVLAPEMNRQLGLMEVANAR